MYEKKSPPDDVEARRGDRARERSREKGRERERERGGSSGFVTHIKRERKYSWLDRQSSSRSWSRSSRPSHSVHTQPRIPNAQHSGDALQDPTSSASGVRPTRKVRYSMRRRSRGNPHSHTHIHTHLSRQHDDDADTRRHPHTFICNAWRERTKKRPS